ncbi:MAG: hypothetical protein SWL02_09755 [Pseudomonadota bacterium]|nr:hypothetical protein [Pseudomonadota bacterium]
MSRANQDRKGVTMTDITISEIEAIRQKEDVLLAHFYSNGAAKELHQSLATQQYKLVIINDCVSQRMTGLYMTLSAAVDAYNSINIKHEV